MAGYQEAPERPICAHSRDIGRDFGEIALLSRVAFTADYDFAATAALAEEGWISRSSACACR